MEIRKRKPRIYDDEYYQDFNKLPDLFEIKIGKNLLPLVYEENGAPLLKEITCCRNQFDDEYGISLPKIRIRDNRFLKENEYIIYMHGSEITRATIKLGTCLCMDTGKVSTQLNIEKWEKTKEPAFDMDAFIIPEDECETFKKAGYVVVFPERIIGVHLYEVIRQNRTKILNQCMINNLIDKIRINNPDVIDDVFFKNDLKITYIKIILNTLLEESVPIKDINTILETIADYIEETKNPFELTEKIRQRLAYSYIPKYLEEDHKLHCLKLSVDTSILIAANIQNTSKNEKPFLDFSDIDIEEKNKLKKSLDLNLDLLNSKNYSPVIICVSSIRLPLASFIHREMPGIPIFSDAEVYSLNNSLNIEVEGEITIDA